MRWWPWAVFLAGLNSSPALTGYESSPTSRPLASDPTLNSAIWEGGTGLHTGQFPRIPRWETGERHICKITAVQKK
jgi:hypothetical protein